MRKLMGLALVCIVAVSPLRAADIDKFIPEDTEQVAYLDIRGALASDLFKKHGQSLLEDFIKNDKNLSQVLKALNFDPMKDLDNILVTNSGTTGEKTLIVVRGNLDEDRVKKLFEEDKSDMHKIHKEGDLVVYELKDKDRSIFGSFADKKTLVLSMTKDMTVKVVTGKGGKPGKELEAAIKGVDGKQTFWMVGAIPDELKKILAQQEGISEIAPKLKFASLEVKSTDSADIAFKIMTDDEKASAEVEKTLDSLKAIAGFFADSNDEYGALIKEVMKTFKVKTDKTTTTVTLTLSDKVIEKAMTKIPKK